MDSVLPGFVASVLLFYLTKRVSWSVFAGVLVSANYKIIASNSKFDPVPTQNWDISEKIKYDNVLGQITKHYFGEEYYGLESMAFDQKSGFIYASSKNGQVLQLRLDDQFQLVMVQAFDYGAEDMDKRPLGVRISPFSDHLVYFVDAYQGIFSLDTNKGSVSLVHGNKSMPYLNDFDFLWNGDLVLSEPSTRYSDQDFHKIVLEGRPTGRILRYSHEKNELSVVLDGLHTSNGIESGADRRTVYFSEMTAYRIQKFTFTGDNYNIKVETVISGLPGMPDNIRFSSDSKILMVPLPEERLDLPVNFAWFKHYALFIYEHFFLQNGPYFGDFAQVLFLDVETGQITKAWRDEGGNKVGGITQVLQIDDKNYLFGSDTSPALFALKL